MKTFKNKYPSHSEKVAAVSMMVPNVEILPQALYPKGNIPPENQIEIVVYTLTVYGEARGEPKEGQRAVAETIYNRWLYQGWFGDSIRDVCVKDDDKFSIQQFSCWNKEDPNYKKLSKPDPVYYYQCLNVVKDIYFYGGNKYPTNMYNYHSVDIEKPQWAEMLTEYKKIGNHIFYVDNT